MRNNVLSIFSKKDIPKGGLPPSFIDKAINELALFAVLQIMVSAGELAAQLRNKLELGVLVDQIEVSELLQDIVYDVQELNRSLAIGDNFNEGLSAKQLFEIGQEVGVEGSFNIKHLNPGLLVATLNIASAVSDMLFAVLTKFDNKVEESNEKLLVDALTDISTFAIQAKNTLKVIPI